jgi:hypothetical protein
MSDPIKITERIAKPITDGMHFAFRFSNNGDDIGWRVSFDIIAKCEKALHVDPPGRYCTPKVQVEHIHLQGYLEHHFWFFNADMMIDFGLTDIVQTAIPGEEECVKVQVILNAYYHAKEVPVVIAHGKGSITLVGQVSGSAEVAPTLTESIDCKICCKDCKMTIIADPPPPEFSQDK